MPIENLSNKVKIPRLGKIHLGVKATTNKSGKPIEYPKAVDYFVVPDEVKAIYGDKPKELEIMFPVEEIEQFAPQFLKAYSLSQGLVCRGNGIRAHRKIDVKTGAIADSKTEMWEWKDIPCNQQECPEYEAKKCKQVLNLLFLLPEVPGLGAWQIDTSSYHSIVNINSMVLMLKGMLGRCSMLPLTLTLRPLEVTPPGMKKKTIHVLDIKKDIKLADFAKKAMLPVAQVLMPEISDEMPEDLYPVNKISEESSVTQQKEAGEQQKDETTSPPDKKTASETKETTSAPEESAASPSDTPEQSTDELPPPIKQDEQAPKNGEETKTDEEKLIQRIHIEASKVDDTYYEACIRPKIKLTFDKDSSTELNKAQLNTVLAWMTAIAPDNEKRAFVLEMKDLGYTTKESLMQKIKEVSGKEGSWTRADFTKTVMLAESEKAWKDVEDTAKASKAAGAKSDTAGESDKDVDDFITESGKLL